MRIRIRMLHICYLLGIVSKEKYKQARIMLKYKPFTPPIEYIGKYSYSGKDIEIVNSKQTKIGKFCSIGLRVKIGHGEHPIHFLSTSPYLCLDRLGFKTDKTNSHNEYEILPAVEIGNDVWIGDDVFIKNGIKIGDGAVIGAKSLVTHDVEPYAIVAGSPAKVLRYRFNHEIINQLLKLKWWDLEDDIIKQIPYDDIEKSIQFLINYRNNNT